MGHTVHIICGPTAGGKSAAALKMAQQLNGVIINADSMQIYDGLPILTAQPTPQEKETVPHKFYGALKPDEICSAGNWRKLVEPLIHETLAQGKTPIIVGGSGLYINALVKGLSPIPEVPPAIREQATQKQKDLGNPAFYEELKKHDPVMAERANPYHTSRLVRAWEVLIATGKSIAVWQKLPLIGPPSEWQFEIHKIMPERDVLYERCNMRFLNMIENGAIEEVEKFAATNTKPTPLTKALGYTPLLSYIRGDLDKDEAITRAQSDTRHYAKRQVTWFRNQI